MSPSTLSRLESGKRQASLELLVPLTRQLGLRVDDLLVDAAPDPRVRRPSVRSDHMISTPLAPEGSSIQTYKIVLLPLPQPRELRVHDGYEWLYVLSGRVRLRLGEQDLTLVRGEAAEFDTRVPHSISAAGSRPAQIISIFNETGVRMHIHSPRPSESDSEG
jgi:quercetin dioxygenase-like cupin family protein